jgi:hypothetical protein
MPENAQEKFAIIQNLNFEKSTPVFWLVKRKIVKRQANYGLLRVDIDSKLQNRFKDYLQKQLLNKPFVLNPYNFISSDADDSLYTIDGETTDFAQIEGKIRDGFNNHKATEQSQLLDSWAYLIEFVLAGSSFFAWRKVSGITQPKRVISRKALFFQNQCLVDVDDRPVFLIDSYFDFFAFNGLILIANKREFEISMNFRVGMKNHADTVLKELESLGYFTDIEPIRDYVGDNLNHLRRLSAIKYAGYYKQQGYLDRLMQVSQQEGWNLKIEHGKIVVEANSVELLLKLLNNDRLRSPINHELFDSTSKALI